MTELYCCACGGFIREVSGSAPPVPVRHRSCNGSVNASEDSSRFARFGANVTHEH